jgi:hypothetical protein
MLHIYSRYCILELLVQHVLFGRLTDTSSPVPQHFHNINDNRLNRVQYEYTDKGRKYNQPWGSVPTIHNVEIIFFNVCSSDMDWKKEAKMH